MNHLHDKVHFPPGFDTWIQIVYAYEKTGRLYNEWIKPLGLSVPQHELMANLFRDDGLTQQELARRMMVSKGNVTGLINRLSALGFVERKQCEVDARSNQIFLTEEGRKVESEALKLQAKLITQVMSIISEDEQHNLNEIMKRVQTKVEELKAINS